MNLNRSLTESRPFDVMLFLGCDGGEMAQRMTLMTKEKVHSLQGTNDWN